MKRIALTVCLCALAAFCKAGVSDDELILRRGDANADGTVNVSDASRILNWLYSGGPAPPCMNQADSNDDGVVNQSDAAHLLNWLYSGGPEPPAPGPYGTSCAADDYPYPGCQVSPCP